MIKKEPLRIVDEIQVFSETDDYIENYEDIAFTHVESYKATGTNPFMNETFWKISEDATLQMIEKHCELSTDSKILDVGVGLGRLLSALPSGTGEKFGMDISLNYLNLTKEKDIKCVLAKIEDMPFEDESFDVVVCTDVLEHVIDLNLCSNNIVKVIKKGGYLVVRTPCDEDLSQYVFDKRFRYVHLRTFNENSLRLLFEKLYGLQFLDSKAVFIPHSFYGKDGLPSEIYFNQFLYHLYNEDKDRDIIEKILSEYYRPYEIVVVFKK